MAPGDCWRVLEDLASRAGSWESALSSRGAGIVRVETPREALEAVLERAGTSPVIVVTDNSFAGEILERTLESVDSGRIVVHKIDSEDIVWVETISRDVDGRVVVCGFGGGRPIDIAKMVASELGALLFVVPTAPSHDGIASSTSSLLVGGKKKSIRTKRPDLVVVPRNLWRDCPPVLYKSGVCDVVSNITALEDVSLSMQKTGFEASMEHAALSALAVLELAKGEGDETERLGRALVLSGLAMEKWSNYGSGGEHEVEKALSRLSHHSRHPHGQLAGFGTLLSSFLYSENSGEMPSGLWFSPESLFGFVSGLMRDLDVLGFALAPWTDLSPGEKKETARALSGVSGIRPERYTIWNLVDSSSVDFESLMERLLSQL